MCIWAFLILRRYTTLSFFSSSLESASSTLLLRKKDAIFLPAIFFQKYTSNRHHTYLPHGALIPIVRQWILGFLTDRLITLFNIYIVKIFFIHTIEAQRPSFKDTKSKISSSFSKVYCGRILVSNHSPDVRSAFVAPLTSFHQCLRCWNQVWNQSNFQSCFYDHGLFYIFISIYFYKVSVSVFGLLSSDSNKWISVYTIIWILKGFAEIS